MSRRPRVAPMPPETLDPERRKVYEAITGGPRGQGPQAFALTDPGGGLRGPFNAMLLSPAIGHALQALGAAVRYSGELTDRERELAVLAVARHRDSAFEWDSHEAVGIRAGLTAAELRAVRDGTALPDGADEREIAVLDWARLLVSTWDADTPAYDRTISALGRAVAYEVSVLVGYYSVLALHLRVFGDEHGKGMDR